MDGRNLAKRLMDGDPTYDHRMEWPMDKDGWAKVVERLMTNDDPGAEIQ